MCVFKYSEGFWGMTPEKFEIWVFKCAILWHFPLQFLEFTEVFDIVTPKYGLRT